MARYTGVNHLAMVTKTSQDTVYRPCIRIIANEQGELDQPREIDLTDNTYSELSIVRLIDESKYNIDLSKFILSE